MTWYYQGIPVESIDIQEYPSFVYCITNLLDNRFYIGYKQTLFTKTKQVKGKKKKVKVESDWRDYWSSSEELKGDVLQLGEQNFKREILHFCKSKSMASYLEAREQIDRRVLETPEICYNRMVNCRVSHNHIKKYLEEIKTIDLK